MTCANEIHVDDKNTRFIITISDSDCVAINISAYTTLNIIFTKPDGTIVTKTALFVTDGTDGQIYYATVAGDLDQSGVWKIQAYVGSGSSTAFSSNIKIFKVYCNLG